MTTVSDTNVANAETLMSGVPIADIRLPDSMKVTPTGASCGVILEGIDLSQHLSGEKIVGLIALANHAGVVVLRGQDRLTPVRQGVVMEWFGQPFFRTQGVDNIAMLERTTVQILGSQAKDGLSDIPHADVDNGRDLVPHSDVQDYQVTPTYTMIHGVEVVAPSEGGNTYFANLYQAYDELSDEDKELVEGLYWMPASSQATAYGVGMKSAKEDVAARGHQLESPVRHPVVRTHPVTGRKALWVSTGFTVRIEGVGSEQDGKRLAKRLKDYCNSERFVYKHEWTKHDVLLWDNRCVNHWRDGWPATSRRTLHRSQAGASRPF